ncbi:MAG: phospholipase [Anaerolineae bacterium]|jgi:hypothetical protein|nr:phospholipase [Anaerolineae bacterium]
MKLFAPLFALAFGFLILFASSTSSTVSAQYVPTPNGCGPENGPNVPDYFSFYNLFGRTDRFPFVFACNVHDVCYGTLGASRAACDTQFLNNLLSICRNYSSTWVSRQYCNGLAYTYYYGVHWFGEPAFQAAQNRARAGV